jgi:hypothetical protein
MLHMIQTHTITAPKSSHLSLLIDGVEVDVRGSGDLVAVLGSIYRRHRRDGRRDSDMVRGVRLRLSCDQGTAAANAASACERIARSVAECAGGHVMRAAALERDGRALLITGSPGSGKSTLAVNLLAGGWRLLADDNVLLSADGTEAIAHQALIALSARSMWHVPAIFRKAIESSHWHSADGGRDLRFFEVDPTLVFGSSVWADRAGLDAIVLLMRSGAESRMRTIDAAHVIRTLGPYIPSRLNLASDVRVGAIALSRATRCAQAVDMWFDAHVT